MNVLEQLERAHTVGNITFKKDNIKIPFNKKREIYFCCCICRKLESCLHEGICPQFKDYEPIYNNHDCCFKCSSKFVEIFTDVVDGIWACSVHKDELKRIINDMSDVSD